jgi:hypothetical protein
MMQKIVLIIDILLIMYSIALYIKALIGALRIEHNWKAELLLHRLFDETILFRTAMLLKLFLLLSMSVLLLFWYTGVGLIATKIFYGSLYLTVISLFISVAWFTLALLMFLIYRRKDFTIFKLTKQTPK